MNYEYTFWTKHFPYWNPSCSAGDKGPTTFDKLVEQIKSVESMKTLFLATMAACCMSGFMNEFHFDDSDKSKVKGKANLLKITIFFALYLTVCIEILLALIKYGQVDDISLSYMRNNRCALKKSLLAYKIEKMEENVSGSFTKLMMI